MRPNHLATHPHQQSGTLSPRPLTPLHIYCTLHHCSHRTSSRLDPGLNAAPLLQPTSARMTNSSATPEFDAMVKVDAEMAMEMDGVMRDRTAYGGAKAGRKACAG